MRRGVGCAAAALAAALAMAAPAGAGPPSSPFKVRTAKQQAGPYETVVFANLAPGRAKSFWFRARNTTDAPFQVELTRFNADPAYRQKYFRRNGVDITAAVTGPGFDFELGPGKAKFFRMKVRAIGDAPADPYCSITKFDGDVAGGLEFGSVGLNGADCD